MITKWVIKKIVIKLKKARLKYQFRGEGKLSKVESYKKYLILDTVIKALDDA